MSIRGTATGNVPNFAEILNCNQLFQNPNQPEFQMKKTIPILFPTGGKITVSVSGRVDKRKYNFDFGIGSGRQGRLNLLFGIGSGRQGSLYRLFGIGSGR